MNGNGTAKWIGIIATLIIVLGFGTTGAIIAEQGCRQAHTEENVERMDKSQAVILYRLDEINDKLDRLLE